MLHWDRWGQDDSPDMHPSPAVWPFNKGASRIKHKHSVWIFIFTRRENFGKFEVLSTKSKNLTGGKLL